MIELALSRRLDWVERLDEWVEANRWCAHQWGMWDCASAAADGVEYITDSNPLGGLVWADVKGALRQLQAEGGLEAAVTARLGAPIAPAFAQRGDVVLLAPESTRGDGMEQGALAVCIGERAVSPGADGMEFTHMRMARRAWKVGRG